MISFKTSCRISRCLWLYGLEGESCKILIWCSSPMRLCMWWQFHNEHPCNPQVSAQRLTQTNRRSPKPRSCHRRQTRNTEGTSPLSNVPYSTISIQSTLNSPLSQMTGYCLKSWPVFGINMILDFCPWRRGLKGLVELK